MAGRDRRDESDGEVAVRAFLLSGVRLYREALALALERSSGIEVVGHSDDWQSAVPLLATEHVDVVLLDMALPVAAGAIAEIAALADAPRIVAIARTDDVGEVLACAEAGISGYVASADSIASAVEAIESAARGELLTTPRVAAVLLERVRTLAAAAPTVAVQRLTPREREIAELLGEGCTNKAIAQRLGIEPTTVKNHVHNILEKLQVHRRTDAALLLRTNGLDRFGAAVQSLRVSPPVPV
jgi:two-component system, NarL family, nitrate/nitrite response regulator NarL